MTHPILILNGPNLNLLGTREPAIYGRDTLDDIRALCATTAATHGLSSDFRQTNHEGVLVDWIQEARHAASGIIINAGAYTHTSIAIQDALLACDKPVVEVHLSNLFRREPFRHHSTISSVAVGLICGFGAQGYALAIAAIAARLPKAHPPKDIPV